MYKYFLVARNLNKFYVKPQKEAGQYYISLKSKTKEFVKYNSRNRKKHFPNDKKIKKKKQEKNFNWKSQEGFFEETDRTLHILIKRKNGSILAEVGYYPNHNKNIIYSFP